MSSYTTNKNDVNKKNRGISLSGWSFNAAKFVSKIMKIKLQASFGLCRHDRVIGLQYGSKGNIVFGSRRRQPITLLDTWSATWTIKISAKLKQQIKTRRLYMTRQMGEY